jgi:hypothetical protein
VHNGSTFRCSTSLIWTTCGWWPRRSSLTLRAVGLEAADLETADLETAGLETVGLEAPLFGGSPGLVDRIGDGRERA